MKIRALAKWMVGMAACAVAAPAVSEFRYEFNYNQTCVSGPCTWGNTRAPSSVTGGSGAPTLSAQAWSDTGGLNPGDATAPLETAYLSAFNGTGLGVQNRDSATLGATFGPSAGGGLLGGTTDATEGNPPEHGMDNNQRFDSILFSFSSAVELSKIRLGWSQTDSDLFVLAYTAGGAPTLAGKNYSDLTTSGWQLIANLSDVPTSDYDVNAGKVPASHWLIGTTNPVFGGGFSTGNDYTKLLAVFANTPTNKTPEPGSLLLLGSALFIGWRLRRRQPA